MVVVSDVMVMDVVLYVELAVGAPLSCEAAASHITNAVRKFTMVFFEFHQEKVLIRPVSIPAPSVGVWCCTARLC